MQTHSTHIHTPRTLLVAIALLLGIPTAVCAQASRHALRQGNRAYNKEHFDQAEVNYRRALESDSTDFRGQYNLASSLYRQQKYDEAASHYQQALGCGDIDNHRRARTLHNLGNSLVRAGQAKGDNGEGIEQFSQAVSAYQESLKLEPKDNDTRHNLAYARQLLQQAQQQQQQQQQGNDKQQGDQDKQQQQQQQDQQQQQQNQQQSQQQQGQNQQQQPQQQLGEQRKQDAERMLEAVKNNERQTLKEQNRKEQAVKAHHTDKDW